jgi:hypothetical protein
MSSLSAHDNLHPGEFTPYITPERRHEVEAAMPPVFIGKSQNEATPTLRPGNMGKRGKDGMSVQHKVAREIMRSDVPVEHLKGIEHIQVGTRLPPGTTGRTMSYTDAAPKNKQGKSYMELAPHYNTGQPTTHFQRDQRQRTMVHEIGHHKDPASRDLTSNSGEREANAENYADKYQGAMKHPTAPVYDDPENGALSSKQMVNYSAARVKP